MALRRLVYLSRIQLPNPRSHSLQMVRTCHALAEAGVPVDFFVQGEEPVDRGEAIGHYGLELSDGLAVHTLRRRECRGLGLIRRLLAIAWRGGPGTALYTRDVRLASHLVRLRPLLRLPVFLESHARDGFFDWRDIPAWVEGLAAGHPPDPHATKHFGAFRHCYRRANGIVCLLRSTVDVVRQAYPATPALWAWHGTSPAAGAAYDPEARHGIYYVGSLYDFYRPESLVEALALLPGHELFVVGGTDESDVARTRAGAERAGVAGRVHFVGHVAPARLPAFYARCRVAVTLFAGQKIADYLSHGLPIVAPDLPSVREVLEDGHTAVFFERGSAQSLAAALRRVLDDRELACRLARAAAAAASDHAWPLRARRILRFIESAM